MRIISALKKCKRSDLFRLKKNNKLSIVELQWISAMSVSNLEKNFKSSNDETSFSFATLFLIAAQLSLSDKELLKVFNKMNKIGINFKSAMYFKK